VKRDETPKRSRRRGNAGPDEIDAARRPRGWNGRCMSKVSPSEWGAASSRCDQAITDKHRRVLAILTAMLILGYR
jgi:hypothetical protein